VPGGSLDGAVRALLTGARPGVLHADLAACDAYKAGPPRPRAWPARRWS
jgi:hypothetical protein